METASERRRRKLLSLKDKYGLRKVAEQAGVNPQTLDQVIKGRPLPMKADGTRSPRQLGDAAARRIEAGLNLGEGWFDRDDAPVQRASGELQTILLSTFEKFANDEDRFEALAQMRQLLKQKTAPEVSAASAGSLEDHGAAPRRSGMKA